MALLFSVLLCLCASAFGFNVDIPSRVVYRGNYQSMFGFTVQSHIHGDRKMILVGAPADDPLHINGVTKPGAVYRCRPGSRDGAAGDQLLHNCDHMEFTHKRENNIDSASRQIDEKSNQWFGATLTSSGPNSPIVACAPRYVSYVTAKLNQREAVGTCFVAKSPEDVNSKEFSPCRTWHRYLDEEICERLVDLTRDQRAGSYLAQRISLALQRGNAASLLGTLPANNQGTSRLFLGAPGSFYWQGQLYEYGQGNKPILSTPESGYKYDDTYMGYSMTVGDFAGNGVQGVAVGVPRGADLRGLVVIYNWELQFIKNISGSQIGAYFGYSLACADVDGDGKDDLIIGAPMFTKKRTDGYEHGRIYVIYQGKDSQFTKNHARTGEVSRGRFGLAVTSLGDINYDGFGDIAVGAPYGGENGRGVVYIYHGSELGLSEKYSQAITAEEISPSLSTFGFSLSGGVDLDNNNYTDLAVGAYKSDSVVFLKSRPVVKVMAEVRFMGETKLISLEEKRCRLNNGTRVACAHLKFCLNYNGVNVDQQINFVVTLDLDSRLTTAKRIYLINGETTYSTHILLTQGNPECRDITVYLVDEIRDKLTPIEVKMTYDLITQPSGSVVPPVLDQTKSIEHTDSLNIQKNCGPDNICIPNLSVAATSPTVNYVLGSGENVHLDINVENSGDDAFEAAYYLQIPAGVTYTKMEKLDDDKTPIYCSIKNKGGNSTLKCDLGNPMPKGQKLNFRVILEVDAKVPKLTFDMETNSTNPEQGTGYDNVMHMTIGVVIKAHLSIIGTSDPPELHYNASLYEADNLADDTKLGPQVIHRYNIKNEGPFAVEESEIYIMWPYQTLTGENLMYMLVEPQWAGNIQCDVARNINPDNLLIQNPYSNLLTKEASAITNSKSYTASQTSGGRFNYQSNQQGQGQGRQYYSRSSSETNNRASQSQTGYRNVDQDNRATQFNQGQGRQFATNSQGSQSGTYNRAWSKSWDSLSMQEQEDVKIRATQAHGGDANARAYWENLSSAQQDHIIRNVNSGSSFAHNNQNWQSGQSGSSSNHFNQDSSYNRAWSRSWEGLTADERENIRRNLAAQSQSSRTHSEGKVYWESLSASEQENIRRSLIAAARGYDGSQSGHSLAGYGNGAQIVRVKNRTIVYDADNNIISETESSTEYGNLGHEGEAESSFNKYNQNRNNQGSYNSQESYQGGYVQGSSQGNYHNQGNVNAGRGSGQGFRHSSWTTTETVNSDLMNAGSVTFRGGPSVTVDGDEDDEIGGIGVYGAQGANNQFKYGIGEVSGAQENYGSSHSSQGGGYQGGGSVSAAYGSRSGGGGSYSYSSSSSSSGSYGSSSHQQRHENTRRRREDKVDPELKQRLETCQEKYKCEVLRCSTGQLLKGQEVWIALRSRFNATVLNEISKDREVILSSLATTRVTKLPIVGVPKESTWQTAEAQTTVTPQLEALESGTIPLWVVVLAAVLGALLLLLLIFLLYKCGFFKRNRVSDHNERQPLNGRDEHL